MSILIKGIDMPKEGRLKIEITSDGLVWIDTGRRFYAHKDYAIQIPTPHGRLIEEHYPGELQAKQPEGLFVMYRSADKDTDRFILEAEE